MKLPEIKRKLSGPIAWTPATQAALERLHEGARKEESAGEVGEFVALERAIFGDPRGLMSEHKDYGPGFEASLMDGPELCLFKLAGIEEDDALSDKVWGEWSWQDLLVESLEAEFLDLYETDSPGISDSYYWIRVEKPSELARELRVLIARAAVGKN